MGDNEVAGAGCKVQQPEPADAWDQALSQLQTMMPRDVFERLLRGSFLVEADGDRWTIGVRPHAVDWLANRHNRLIERIVGMLMGRAITLRYAAAEDPPPVPVPEPSPPDDDDDDAQSPTGARSPTAGRLPARTRASTAALESLLAFDPNSAKGGGFWKMGHYANWFWAAFLGSVAWRVYELVISGDRRAQKTEWTPPRRYSISELARAVASGRRGRPNREQIRGRYRRVGGERVWRPGAFDRLAEEGVARIEWHGGELQWRPWQLGGSSRPGKSGLRIVYRISVVTSLPLLSPQQVACLPAENQVEHERYLADRAQDVVAWEQITLPTLAGLDAAPALARH